MKTSTIIKLVLIFELALTVWFTEVARSQRIDVTDQDFEAVDAAVVAMFGRSYGVADVANIDVLASLIPPSTGWENPYSTLSNGLLFVAEKWPKEGETSRVFIGFYRAGQIIWRSDTVLVDWELGRPSINATMDMNNDGNVEIAIALYSGVKYDLALLWVFSYSGQTVSLINAVDGENRSTIVGTTAGEFDYVDVNGDGIKEIIGLYFETEESVDWTPIMYSWNGQLYGKWQPMPTPLPGGHFPRSQVNAIVRCKVAKLTYGFRFQYDVENRVTSRQWIDEFYLQCPTMNVSSATWPTNWFISSANSEIVGWAAIPPFGRFIRQGTRDTVFAYATNDSLVRVLPVITPYYLRGHNPSPADTITESNAWYQEMITNSATGLTVGSRGLPPPDPFGSIWFTDTLISYTTRSRALSWILNQSTSDKYTGIFTRVKEDLQQGDKASALARLDTVLLQVPLDSTAALLTSEAYALLRFNAEHLRTMIPLDPLPIQLSYFIGSVQPDWSVLLEWGTVSETNNYGFYVEKKRTNDPSWSEAPNSFVPGHGTTIEPHNYAFTDTDAPDGSWQYRLKQVDLDGTVHYIEPIAVLVSGTLLSYFDAAPQNDHAVLLEWGTVHERDNRGFDVQRKLSTETDYQSLRFVDGAGTTSEPQDYSHLDESAQSGTWHYRLVQHHLDGTEYPTEPLTVVIGAGTIISEFGAWVQFDRSVLLQWRTAQERDNKGFEVQKSEKPDSRYENVAFIDGYGTTDEEQKYEYIETNPQSGVWYYRLDQMDSDHSEHFTAPIALQIPQGNVELESFGAESSQQSAGKDVKLTWTTRREEKTVKFEIEVSKDDSLHFRPVAGSRVQAAGRSAAHRVYHFTHKKRQSGVWYYRLKLTQMPTRAGGKVVVRHSQTARATLR
ncbi:MAG: hypothetical protein HY961_10340 [Ignavibacteriae bacterium]|nr:hypothetical protein [Ignavibacteriota bacterium]